MRSNDLSSNDPSSSQEELILRASKETLINIRSQLLYGQDLRTLKKSDIDVLESDLRHIIMNVEALRLTPHIHKYLDSMDGFQFNLRSAINSLYLASDLLERGTKIAEKKSFYEQIRQCSDFLLKATKFISV